MHGSTLDDEFIGLPWPVATSILGIKGSLRIRPHGSTQKAHVTLQRVDPAEYLGDDEVDTSVVYFSLFAQKRIEVKPGKEILVTVASLDGRFKDRPVIFEGDALLDSDFESEEEEETLLPVEDLVPPKMRMRSMFPKQEIVAEKREIGIQASTEMAFKAVQVQPGLHSIGTQAQPDLRTVGAQAEPGVRSISSQAEPDTRTIGSQIYPNLRTIGSQVEPDIRTVGSQTKLDLRSVSSQACPGTSSAAIQAVLDIAPYLPAQEGYTTQGHSKKSPKLSSNMPRAVGISEDAKIPVIEARASSSSPMELESLPSSPSSTSKHVSMTPPSFVKPEPLPDVIPPPLLPSKPAADVIQRTIPKGYVSLSTSSAEGIAHSEVRVATPPAAITRLIYAALPPKPVPLPPSQPKAMTACLNEAMQRQVNKPLPNGPRSLRLSQAQKNSSLAPAPPFSPTETAQQLEPQKPSSPPPEALVSLTRKSLINPPNIKPAHPPSFSVYQTATADTVTAQKRKHDAAGSDWPNVRYSRQAPAAGDLVAFSPATTASEMHDIHTPNAPDPSTLSSLVTTGIDSSPPATSFNRPPPFLLPQSITGKATPVSCKDIPMNKYEYHTSAPIAFENKDKTDPAANYEKVAAKKKRKKKSKAQTNIDSNAAQGLTVEPLTPTQIGVRHSVRPHTPSRTNPLPSASIHPPTISKAPVPVILPAGPIPSLPALWPQPNLSPIISSLPTLKHPLPPKPGTIVSQIPSASIQAIPASSTLPTVTHVKRERSPSLLSLSDDEPARQRRRKNTNGTRSSPISVDDDWDSRRDRKRTSIKRVLRRSRDRDDSDDRRHWSPSIGSGRHCERSGSYNSRSWSRSRSRSRSLRNRRPRHERDSHWSPHVSRSASRSRSSDWDRNRLWARRSRSNSARSRSRARRSRSRSRSRGRSWSRSRTRSRSRGKSRSSRSWSPVRRGTSKQSRGRRSKDRFESKERVSASPRKTRSKQVVRTTAQGEKMQRTPSPLITFKKEDLDSDADLLSLGSDPQPLQSAPRSTIPKTDSTDSNNLKGNGNNDGKPWPGVQAYHFTRVVAALAGEVLKILGVKISKDGNMIALRCSDKTIRIYSNRTHLEMSKLSCMAPLVDIYWMRGDISIIALDMDGKIYQWDKDKLSLSSWNMRQLMNIAPERSSSDKALLFAYEGDKIAVVFPSTGVKVWVWTKGVWLIQRTITRQHVTAIRFVNDGKALLGGTKDGVLWHCEVPGGNLRASSFLKDKIIHIAINPSETCALVSLSTGKAHIVNLPKGDEQPTILTDKDDGAYSPGSDVRFAGAMMLRNGESLYGRSDGHVLVWGKSIVVCGLDHGTDRATTMTKHEDGRGGYIVTGTGKGRLMWWTLPQI